MPARVVIQWNYDAVKGDIQAQLSKHLVNISDTLVNRAKSRLVETKSIDTGRLYSSVKRSGVSINDTKLRVDIYADMSYSLIHEKRKSYLLYALLSLRS